MSNMLNINNNDNYDLPETDVVDIYKPKEQINNIVRPISNEESENAISLMKNIFEKFR